ncbi:DUF5701 family protein [Streptomyces sp. BBFR102]|uniref:DUF5701 family protein n=1 Tax=Streptomyces sp. BBFR102 TaxID=3448171 RepID=UPI003F52F5BA
MVEAETEEVAGFDAGGEFDRQVARLLEAGYPALAGVPEEEFAERVTPLRKVVADRAATLRAPEPENGRVPFLLVISRELVPVEAAVARTSLAGKSRPGLVDRNYGPGALERFTTLEELRLPGRPVAHLLFGVERGEEFCGTVPAEAMAEIAGRGRTTLTVEEGIALVTQYPAALATNKCFSLGATRCGDRRVPALWISQGAPKLGWCWEGNPHTWLGMASADGGQGARVGL